MGPRDRNMVHEAHTVDRRERSSRPNLTPPATALFPSGEVAVKDREDDQGKSTDSFGRDDLLVLAKVADATQTWICGQGQEREADAPDRSNRSWNSFR